MPRVLLAQAAEKCYFVRMADFFDYLDWRGDVPFTAMPLNSVDALLLCQLSYLNFSGIVPHEFRDALTLAEAARRFDAAARLDSCRADMGALINGRTPELLQCAAASPRFSALRLLGFADKIDVHQEEQFSALTAVLPDGAAFVAFRGTDDTIVGWKEDFNLGFMTEIPAQKDAAAYLEAASAALPECRHIYAGGHSKGGNLALYAAVFCPERTQARMDRVFSFDAPGLTSESTSCAAFSRVSGKIAAFYPQLSIVGMLFEHPEKFTVVKSDGIALRQHDPFTWQVKGAGFEIMEDLEQMSLFVNRTVNAWIASLSAAKRRTFVEALFDVLGSSGASTNSELQRHWFRTATSSARALLDMEPAVRKEVLGTLRRLLQVAVQ